MINIEVTSAIHDNLHMEAAVATLSQIEVSKDGSNNTTLTGPRGTNVTNLTGHYQFDLNGNILSGVITRLLYFNGNASGFTITDMNLDVSEYLSASQVARSGSIDDFLQL